MLCREASGCCPNSRLRALPGRAASLLVRASTLERLSRLFGDREAPSAHTFQTFSGYHPSSNSRHGLWSCWASPLKGRVLYLDYAPASAIQCQTARQDGISIPIKCAGKMYSVHSSGEECQSRSRGPTWD